MVLRNVLFKCHNFPVNGQRDEGIITGRWAKKQSFGETGTVRAEGSYGHAHKPLGSREVIPALTIHQNHMQPREQRDIAIQGRVTLSKQLF